MCAGLLISYLMLYSYLSNEQVRILPLPALVIYCILRAYLHHVPAVTALLIPSS